MAIACFRLFTVLPLRPLLRVPSLRSCIAFSTFFEAPLEYFLATLVYSCFHRLDPSTLYASNRCMIDRCAAAGFVQNSARARGRGPNAASGTPASAPTGRLLTRSSTNFAPTGALPRKGQRRALKPKGSALASLGFYQASSKQVRTLESFIAAKHFFAWIMLAKTSDIRIPLRLFVCLGRGVAYRACR
jgi:hypothetical protein